MKHQFQKNTIMIAAFMLFLGVQMNAQGQGETLATAHVDPVNAMIESENRTDAPVLTTIQMRDLQNNEPMLVVLDTRNREAFDLGSISRAKFMGEEFSLEKIWMLNRQSPVIVYGNDTDKNKEVCSLLLEKGFTKVHYLYGTLGELAEQGIAMTGDVAKSDKKATKGKK